MNKEIGSRIKALRKQKGLTLKQLAHDANLAQSFLSQVERGMNSLSVKSLRSIATALDVPAFQLIQETENSAVVRKDQRAIIKLPNSGQTYELLSPNIETPLRLIRLVIEAGVSTAKDSVRHTGHEVTTVLQNTIVVILEGVEYSLEQGDSIFFDSSTKHAYYNPGPKTAEIIVATSLTRFL